jgi:hypothetical protein
MWRDKSEARNPKYETNPNDRMTETKRALSNHRQTSFGHWLF